MNNESGLNVVSNPRSQSQFIFQLTQLIESDEAYGSGVDLLIYKIKDDGNIEGKFRDSWNNRIFSFLIANNRLGYKPAITLDSVTLHREPSQASRYFDSFTTGYLSRYRVDAKKISGKRTGKPKCTGISL